MAAAVKPVPLAKSAPATRPPIQFNPYESNGGTVCAIACDDFVVVGGDTRASRSFHVLSRNASKIVQLTDKVFLASGGQRSEIVTLHKRMKIAVQEYEFKHRRQPSWNALSALMKVTLYSRRFFPWYTFNILVGIDDQGKGRSESYDAIGSGTVEPYSVAGSGESLARTVLFSRLDKSSTVKPEGPEEHMELLVNAIAAAAERDIETGDQVEVICLTKDGELKRETVPIRND